MAESSGWPEDFSLRAAKLGDFDFARRLYLDGAHRHLAKIGRWNLRRVGSKFRQGYRQHQAQIICVDGKGVGFIQIAEFVGRLHLRQLHLVAGHRGRGIGSRLVKDLLRRAAGLGRPVTLDVIHGNRARALYLRLGFRQFGADADKVQMIWRPPYR